MAFHDAIKAKYPDMKLVSNCDASSAPLDHPADLFDYHVKTFISFFLFFFKAKRVKIWKSINTLWVDLVFDLSLLPPRMSYFAESRINDDFLLLLLKNEIL